VKLLTHLYINEFELGPGGEWKDSTPGWKIVLVSKGYFYWMARSEVRDLKTGDMLVIGPAVDGVLRASQISAAVLHFFYFRPEHLVGLMSLSERLSLDTFAQTAQTRVISADTPVAKEFLELANRSSSNRRSFFYRCRILHLVAMIFGEAVPSISPTRNHVASTLNRFEEIISRIPDADLVNYSSEKLAEMCGCSLRHFRRMFRKRFKTSIRAKQTEVRLEKAHQLLAETDEKVITIAYESGYRHLGFFNAMFKKRFGVTPSEWRKSSTGLDRPKRKLHRAILIIGFLLIGAAVRGGAQNPAPPDKAPAGVATNAPTATPRGTNTAPTFAVRGYEVQGNTLLSQELLEKIFGDYVGPALTLDRIREALGELQLAYRGRGFVTVAVGLPQQQLTNGVVKVHVTEAKLAEINVEGNRFFSSNNIMAALPSLRTNMLLNNLVFQQELDQANQSRDRQVYPVVGPGSEPGTSALTLKVKDRFPMHGRLDLNNISTPGTPELRTSVSMQYNNLWQLDHQIGGQYTFTPEQYKTSDAWPDFPDYPLIASYSLFYRAPLGDGDYDTRHSQEYGVADFGYDEVTKKFRAPAFSGRSELVVYASRSDSDTALKYGPLKLITKTAIATFESQSSGEDFTINQNFGLKVSKPLPSIRGINWSMNAGLDWKTYDFHSYNTNTFLTTITITNNGVPQTIRSSAAFGQPPIHNYVEYAPVSFGLDAARPDKWGVTVFNWNNSFNLIETQDGAFQKTAGNKEASPQYYIATMGLTRDFNLPGEFQLHLRGDGQWASVPLISNEQFGSGGISGERGYQDGQIYSDSGWRVAFEPRSPLINCGVVDGTETMYARLSVFTDYGQAIYAGSNQPHIELWGTGFGLNVTIGTHFDMRFSWAIALRDVPDWNAGKSRASFGLGYQF
jgi:hemolysin activation/secretion protein/AraC-like DNA-binding protein